MRFLDLCSGIGGFRLGLERAGMECIGYCEIDKFARKSYEAMFDTKGEWTANDITKVTDEEFGRLRGIDLICGGFPCQAFSIAGKRKGFADTRGTIIFHFCRAIRAIQPRWFVFENVKGLLSHDGGALSEESCKPLQNWGIAVNGRYLTARITESRRTGKECSLSDILEKNVEEKYFLSAERTEKILASCRKSPGESKTLTESTMQTESQEP